MQGRMLYGYRVECHRSHNADCLRRTAVAIDQEEAEFVRAVLAAAALGLSPHRVACRLRPLEKRDTLRRRVRRILLRQSDYGCGRARSDLAPNPALVLA